MHREDEDIQSKITTKTLRIYKAPVKINHGVKFLERAAKYMMIGAIACCFWIICIAIYEINKMLGG